MHSWVLVLAVADRVAGALLHPLVFLLLFSGLDDLLLDVWFAVLWWRTRKSPLQPAQQDLPFSAAEKRIAIFVPLWKEHAVVRGMVEHNLAAIRYDAYEFFIGAYPNDDQTLEAVRDIEARFPRVHLAVCPHDGPTSKADCLNWVYQRMLLHEEQQGTTFDIVVTHDAEDLIHPDALRRINQETETFGMVQIPVLPLPLPVHKLVYGVYCDEFAEWQMRDMPLRAAMGSFVPSNGVGTGYRRESLEALAQAEHNLIFEPVSLTEDYENGIRLHRIGAGQTFVRLENRPGEQPVATREYFPQNFRAAVRQRTRWVTGIALQTWERHGWKGNAAVAYWFWRDRRGLIGNPASLLTNLLFAYGASTWALARLTATPWGLGALSPFPKVLYLTWALQLQRLLFRFLATKRVYGFAFACGVPARALVGNVINGSATMRAIYVYARARLLGEPLRWLKTEHAYPSRNALSEHKRKLGEILAGSGYITWNELEVALAGQPPGVRLGEFLVARGQLSEEALYEALSLQQSLPAGQLGLMDVARSTARSLPKRVVDQLRVLPYQVKAGSLFLASPEVPTDETTRELRGFTRLALRFHLVTPANFDELVRSLL